MGIFNRGIRFKNPLEWSHLMFPDDAHDLKKNTTKLERTKLPKMQITEHVSMEYSNKVPKDERGDATTKNPYSYSRPRHIIHKKMLKTDSKYPSHVTKDSDLVSRFDWKPVSSKKLLNGCDSVSDGAAHSKCDSENLLLTDIQHSLSSINLHQSDIELKLCRLTRLTDMTTRRKDQNVQMRTDQNVQTDAMPGNESSSDNVSPPIRNDYVNEMQQQSADECQCCYHEENHHDDYDSHQLPGKLLNFIVLIAIFLHYAIIAFIEPNYFD